MNTVLQDPATVGTLWKTMSARIRGAKTELQELGEEEDEFTQSTSKLQELVKSLTGFDIMKDKDTFKDIYDIIIGIGEAWPSLKDIDKASLGEALAGKRGANGLFAVLDNLDTLKSAYETAENSAGSAAREQENYEKSIQYSLDRLAASAEEFATTFLDSGFVKGIMDIGNAFLGAVTGIDKFAGSLNTVVGIVSTIAAVKGVGPFTGLQNIVGSIGDGKGAGGLIKVSQEQMHIMEAYNLNLIKFKKEGKGVEDVLNTMSAGGVQLSDSFKEQARKAGDAGIQLEEYTTKSKAAAFASGLLTAALNIGLSLAISTTIGLISEAIGRIDKLNDKASQVGESFKTSSDEFSEYNDKIRELKTVMDDSNSSMKEVSDARTELMKIQDEIIEKYGKESEAIDLVTASLDEQDAAYGRVQKKAYEKMITDYNKDDDKSWWYDLVTGDLENEINDIRGLDKFHAQIDRMENYSTSGVGKDVAELMKKYNLGELTGDIYAVKEGIDAVREAAKNAGEYVGSLQDDIDEAAKEVDETLEKNKNMYDAYILNEKILDNDKYTKYYEKINDTAEKFQKARKDGDEEAAKEAGDAYAEAMSEAMENIEPDDENVKNYLKDLYPTLNEEVDSWIFTYRVTPKLDEDDVSKAVDQFRTSNDLKEFNPNNPNASTKQKEAYAKLKQLADENGFEGRFEDFVDMLEQTGYLFSRAKDYMVRRFGINNIVGLTDDEVNLGYSLVPQGSSITFAQLKQQMDDMKKNQYSSFKKAWSMVDVSDDKKDKLGSAKKELVDLQKAGKLTLDVIKKNDFATYLQEKMGLADDEIHKVLESINKLQGDIGNLGDLSEKYKGIMEATQEKKDSKKKVTSAPTLAKLRDTLGVDEWNPAIKEQAKAIKAWKEYDRVMRDSKATMQEVKDAQNALATAFFNTNEYLKDLNNNSSEADKKAAKAALDEMGVLNSAQVVKEQAAYNSHELAKAKLDEAESGRILEEGTYDEVDALKKELDVTGDTTEGILSYIAALIRSGAYQISTAGSIANLRHLLATIKASETELAAFYAMIANGKGATVVKTKVGGKTSYVGSGTVSNKNGTYYVPTSVSDKIKENASNNKKKKKKADDLLKGADEPNIKIGDLKNRNDYKDKGKSNKDKNKSDKNKTKQYIDWIERRMTRINNIIGNIQAKIENIGKWTFGKKMKLSDATDTKNIKSINKELDKEISYYKTLSKVQGVAEKKYLKKASDIAKSKKGKKVLTKSVIKKIQSGQYKKGDFKKWYQGLSDNQKSIVDQYIEFYDKAKSANQGKKESVQKAREAKIQKATNWQTLFDDRISRAEARESVRIGSVEKNKSVTTQLNNLKESYKYQKEIAKLNGDNVEYERLQYEYEQKRRELLYHKIENIKEEYEMLRSVQDRNIQDAENLISVAQAEGRRVNTGWYTSKNINEQKNYDYWKTEREKILEKLGTLTKGTTEYNNALNDLQETENGMAESQKNVADNLTAIRDIIDGVYDEMRENNNFVYEQAQFLASLQRGENINTITGSEGYYKFTNVGIGNMAAARTGIGVAQKNQELDLTQLTEVQSLLKKVEGMSVDEANDYIKNLNDANYSSYEELINAEKKYTKQWMNDRKAQIESENTLIDLMKEYYEGQKSYLSEIIDARKKILDEEKDLYDYEKNINDKTKNIATLQKRLSALSGDNSEAGKARRQQIQNQLDQAQQDLQDTQYERWKSDQESMLENLMTQYNKIIDDHLKQPEVVLEEAKNYLSNNNDKVGAIANNLSDDLPTTIQTEFASTNSILSTNLSGIGSKLDTLNTLLSDYLKQQDKNQDDATAIPEGAQGDPGTSNDGGSKKENTSNVNKLADLINQYNDYKTKASQAKQTNDPAAAVVAKSIEKKATDTKSKIEDMQRQVNRSYTSKNELKLAKVVAQYASTTVTPKSDLNKVLLGQYGYAIKSDALQKLCDAFGINYDGDWSKDGAVYKFFKARKYPGFKTGGIGRLVKANGEDGFAMVRNGEGFVAPEHVDAVQQWMNNAPDVIDMMSAVSKNLASGNTTTMGDVYFELPNVTDPRSFIETFQNNKDMQRLFKVSFQDMAKSGRLTNNIHFV